MKYKILGLAGLALAGFLTMANYAKAASDVTLKEVVLSSNVNTTDKTFTAGAGPADIVFVYTSSTKISGGAKEITPADWQIGDKMAITGQMLGYDNNKLKIIAQTIKYNSTDKQIKKINGFINNVDAENHKVWVSTKEKNLYTLLELNKVTESDGPRLIGFTDFSSLTIGAPVSLNQMWSKSTKAVLKTISITKLNKSENITVVSLIKTTTGYDIESGTPAAVNIKRGQKIALQNKTGANLYFSTLGDSGKFTPKPSSGLILLKNGYSLLYTVNKNSLSGPVNLQFKNGSLETSDVVMTVQFNIVDD